MVDYLTTVAVSITAGVEAIIAFAPALDTIRVPLDVGLILLLMFVNLRGIREAGGLFVIPTYIFVGSLGLLIAWGLFRLTLGGGLPQLPALPAQPIEAVSLFLILRAFAGAPHELGGLGRGSAARARAFAVPYVGRSAAA
jgi:amino acid transporter